MHRERATERPDLPHRYDPDKAAGQDRCLLCHGYLLDERHVAWEKAARQPARNPWFERERGS